MIWKWPHPIIFNNLYVEKNFLNIFLKIARNEYMKSDEKLKIALFHILLKCSK